jgi:mRNA interferase RelE/StbE
MTSYRVVLEQTAQRDFRGLDSAAARQVRKGLLRLEKAPRPRGARKLRDLKPPHYRLRVGDWRVLYTVDDSAMRVHIYRIKHRREAYR